MDGFSVTFPEAVCFGASLALSGVFYYLHRKKKTVVDKLESAPHVTIDEKLRNLLKATPGEVLQYAVIEGTVRPVSESLRSQSHQDVVGVLQKFTLKEHRLVWSGLSRSWMDTERVLHKRVNVVPFFLVGLDETAVRVLSPLYASGEHTEIINEKFHQPSYSFGQLVGQYLSGDKPKGHLEIEEMLKVGTTLTGIGELILDMEGNLCLRPPSDNSQYFLSSADFETVCKENYLVAFWWKTLAAASALAGAAVLLWVALRYYKHLKRRWESEQESQEFARLQAEAARLRANDREAAPNEAHSGNECVICLTHPRDCILLECGHVCCCYVCFQSLPRRKCPICRQDIVRVLPFYQP
ncbi:Mitochondrial ubiquitin ligase activator of nfkb 1-A [Oryzias melastigma]|uniref:RING-type E3 ubiquitin transferase n=1 Tax=Oryzias melastigma TaxID=30732 RepID=A0A3B3CSC5_ORYME|nr:mitochondrial ubiquitin ligase activator of nfkb 1-A [Oryzias melastigma]KAF6728499.1 Mitochondrial ubiquitin ligase activator of nfkb 1-A [Oryzias melastigma]